MRWDMNNGLADSFEVIQKQGGCMGLLKFSRLAMVYSRSKGWPQKVYMTNKIIGGTCARPECGIGITEKQNIFEDFVE